MNKNIKSLLFSRNILKLAIKGVVMFYYPTCHSVYKFSKYFI